MYKDGQLDLWCDDCQKACKGYITNMSHYSDYYITEFYEDEYVKTKIANFDICDICVINIAIGEAKIKLTRPDASIVDALSVCFDMFKHLSDKIRHIDEKLNDLSDSIDKKID